MRRSLLAAALVGLGAIGIYGSPRTGAAPPPAQPASARGLETAVSLLPQLDDPAAQADVLRGIGEALQGRRHVDMPDDWRAAYQKLEASSSAEVRERATTLALVFGDPQAVASLHHVMSDAHADPVARRKAIEALVNANDQGLGSRLLELLDDPTVRDAAIRGLAAYNEPTTAQALLDRYAHLDPIERHDAINTLASRGPWAVALLDAAEQKRVPQSDLSSYTVRQLANLNDPSVNERLKKFWGSTRPPAQDKAALIAQYKKTFTPDLMAKADPSHGRAIFNKSCAICHTLFGTGGNVGPDLTGSQRANLDYVLENVVDPSAVVAKDYLMTLVQTRDGRTLTGIIRREDDKSLTLRMPGQDLVIPKDEIKHRKTSPISMMPEGLLESLSTEDARDLISYLASPTQVPVKE